jgi:hypothetical protein
MNATAERSSSAAPGSADAAGTHQDELVDPMRRVHGQPQRRRTAVGVPDHMGCGETEFVEQSADYVGE